MRWWAVLRVRWHWWLAAKYLAGASRQRGRYAWHSYRAWEIRQRWSD